MRVHDMTLRKHAAMFKGVGTPEWSVAEHVDHGSTSHIIPHDGEKLVTSRDRRRRYNISQMFIMDQIDREARDSKQKCIRRMKEKFATYATQVDQDLLAPYNDALRRAKEKSAEGSEARAAVLHAIQSATSGTFGDSSSAVSTALDTVVFGYNAMQLTLGKIQQLVRRVEQQHASLIEHTFTAKPIRERQNILRGLSKMFHAGVAALLEEEGGAREFSAAELRRIAASYIYKYDSEKRKNRKLSWSRLPWDVAFRELCSIKATALSGHKPLSQDFYDQMAVQRPR
jgi:RNA-dependent RNA polymerase